MDDNVEIFLEHHGIKGQKWGRRKEKMSKKTTPFFKRVNKKNHLTYGQITGAAALGAGAAFTAAFLREHGNRKFDRQMAERIANIDFGTFKGFK